MTFRSTSQVVTIAFAAATLALIPPQRALAQEGDCGFCEEDEGEACGELVSGCAGEGTIECRDAGYCDETEEKVNKLCVFDSPN